MKFPMSMSIIVVQMDEESDAIAYVSYGRNGEGDKATRVEFPMGNVPDAVDPLMWAQMCTALVCDGI